MIIRTDGGRLRLVSQVDHAALAATFAGAWGGKQFCRPEPMAPVELAARVHDDGWQDWDQQPRIQPETGRPYDFLNIPVAEHLGIYERCVDSAMQEHPYAGLLVSLHGTGLYKQRFGHMPHLLYKEVAPACQAMVDRFLGQQEALQQQLLTDFMPDGEALWTHYRWLQAWDALSVFICLGAPRELRSFHLGTMPHHPGGPVADLHVRGAGEGTYTVDPWPFAVRRIDLMIPVRYVPDQRYENDADFLTAFDGAPTEALSVSLIPGS